MEFCTCRARKSEPTTPFPLSCIHPPAPRLRHARKRVHMWPSFAPSIQLKTRVGCVSSTIELQSLFDSATPRGRDWMMGHECPGRGVDQFLTDEPSGSFGDILAETLRYYGLHRRNLDIESRFVRLVQCSTEVHVWTSCGETQTETVHELVGSRRADPASTEFRV